MHTAKSSCAMPLPFPVKISQRLDMSREAPCRGKVALGVHSKNFHKYQILDMAREFSEAKLELPLGGSTLKIFTSARY